MSNQNRPYTICHMMSSVDGKIASGIEGVELFDEYFDLYTKTEDELQGQAWMCGRVTMKMFADNKDLVLPQTDKAIDAIDHIVPSKTNLTMIGIDTKGSLRWKSNTIKLTNVGEPLSLVIIVTEATPKEYLYYLQTLNISYLVCGTNTLDCETLLIKLKNNLNIETLLVEGGGALNGSMLAADMIDEISLLLLPVVVNHTTAPSVFDRQSESVEPKSFTLLEAKTIDRGVVRLRYKQITTTST